MTSLFLQATGERISLGPILASGGEASVYTVTSRPEILAKIFHNSTPAIEEKLLAMISAPPPCVSLGGGYAELVWPFDVVRDADANNACVGYVMRHIRNHLPLDIIANPATCPPQINFQCKLRLAANLAWMLAELHAARLVVGDLHLGNTLGDQAGCISVIDTDSFQFLSAGRVFRCGVGKAESIAPELFDIDLNTIDRTPEQDSFSLAIGIFQLLMDGNHPYQGRWRGAGQRPTLNERIRQGAWPYAQPAPPNWEPRPLSPPFDLLHPLIQDAMIRCFQVGHRNPAMRPTGSEWQRILLTVESDVNYLNKVVPLFTRSSWRNQSPAHQAATIHGKIHPPSLRRIPSNPTKIAISIFVAIILATVGIYALHSAPSQEQEQHTGLPQKQEQQKCSPADSSPDRPNKGKPTPKLWRELRDSL